MLSAHRCLEVFGMNRSDRLRVRESDRRNRRFRPMMEIEKLEPRIAMSHGTIQLGVVQPGQNSVVGGKLARYSVVDFEFQVNAPIIVGAKLAGLSANAELKACSMPTNRCCQRSTTARETTRLFTRSRPASTTPRSSNSAGSKF